MQFWLFRLVVFYFGGASILPLIILHRSSSGGVGVDAATDRTAPHRHPPHSPPQQQKQSSGPAAAAAAAASRCITTTTTWEEIVDDDDDNNGHTAAAAAVDPFWRQCWSSLLQRRSCCSVNGFFHEEDDDSKTNPSSSSSTTSSSSSSSNSNIPPNPHPLRTNLWEIQCRWRRGSQSSPLLTAVGMHTDDDDDSAAPQKKKQQNRRRRNRRWRTTPFLLDFDPTGYVRLQPIVAGSAAEPVNSNTGGGDSTTPDNWIPTTGTWRLDPSGVICRIPVPTTGNEDRGVVESLFTMDYHVNPFGRHPKFTRGVLFRDTSTHTGVPYSSPPPTTTISSWWRSCWPRPVLATFTGRGIGVDTADLSYRNRQQQQPMIPPSVD